MAKETLADKLAKKSFNSAQFQKSWAVHMQAFGPILEPAFVENYQAKVHLAAALNHLSNRNPEQAVPKLKQLQKYIETDADKAACLFFMGLYCELSGMQHQMVEMYTYANEYGHRFYLPYAKVAKYYLSGCLYDRAEENFRAAIACFDATGLDDRDKLLLGAMYTDLASCLTMMHRYDEAEAALTSSRSLYPDAPGRSAAEATLHAIRGDTAQLEAALNALKGHAPEVYEALKESTDKILAHEEALFYPVPVDDEKIAGFWRWFEGYEAELQDKLVKEEFEAALTPVAQQLLTAFSFLEEAPYIALGKNENGFVIQLKDMYAIGIMDAYGKLLRACPEDVTSRWQFDQVH